MCEVLKKYVWGVGLGQHLKSGPLLYEHLCIEHRQCMHAAVVAAACGSCLAGSNAKGSIHYKLWLSFSMAAYVACLYVTVKPPHWIVRNVYYVVVHIPDISADVFYSFILLSSFFLFLLSQFQPAAT